MTTHSVPKNLTKSRLEYRNLPVWYLAVALASAVMILISLSVVILTDGIIIRGIFISIMVLTAYFFITQTRTPEMLEITVLSIKFLFRELRGETEVYHFSDPDEKILKLFGIVQIHKRGIIEYKEKVFGSLMAYDPERVSMSSLEGHIARMQHIIDSLHDDMVLKAYVLNKIDRNRIPLTRYINNIIISDTSKSKVQLEYLKSIYTQEKDKQEIDRAWKFHMFLSLGKRDDIQDAEIAFNRYYEGFTSKMRGLNVRTARIENEKEILRTYKELFV